MGRIKQMQLEEIADAWLEQTEDGEDRDFTDPLVCADSARHYTHRVQKIHMNTDEMEFRYERRGDVYTTKCWYNGNEKTERGLVDQTPEWLGRILAVSRVGNHIRATINPPPDEILWFRTDTNRNLTAFIDLEDTR